MSKKNARNSFSSQFIAERERLEQETLLEAVLAGDADAAFDEDTSLTLHNCKILMEIASTSIIDDIVKKMMEEFRVGTAHQEEGFAEVMTVCIAKTLEKYRIDLCQNTNVALEEIVLGDKFRKSLDCALEEHEVGNNKLKDNVQQDLARSIKKVIIYEAHKRINPQRLSGESKLRNFINNMIVGGMSRANKLEGKKMGRLAGYYQHVVSRQARTDGAE